ncbi:MAG: hypothetical protein KGM99_04500, partial [Burkholderiales bacterium]|nr:hypothetical protein [Burkholderiales bacterium]
FLFLNQRLKVISIGFSQACPQKLCKKAELSPDTLMRFCINNNKNRRNLLIERFACFFGS